MMLSWRSCMIWRGRWNSGLLKRSCLFRSFSAMCLFKTQKRKTLCTAYQIRLDEEATLKLQAKFDKDERLAREKADKEERANIALIEEWDDIQVKIDVDHKLAERLQEQEQEELSNAEKATLFQQLLEKRRNHFTAKRAEEKRNKPPTKA
uniref:Uncharacterized protein n=1 Tax=Tanacetum cinerariifolium TaxID=118510 RepID=A0A699IGW5_TANCI|nr:hypothetical protein [Tanacetum cinerariifolium]